MKHYLIPAMALFAVSACTDQGDTTSSRTETTAVHEADQQRTTDRPSQTDGSSSADRGLNSDSSLTASDQSETESDRQITQHIRQALIDESSLSTKAKNATIITVDGAVTLRGYVDTAAERRLIERKAHEVSGVEQVTNDLEVTQ